jgi:DNA-binding winged helix-turn-helix (wHTH) protein
MKLFPPFELDRINMRLLRHVEGGKSQPLSLPPKAFAMLDHLVEHAGRLVTHRELLQTLWENADVQSDVLKGHIAELRKALDDSAKHPRFIETVARRGYKFIAPVNESAPSTVLPANAVRAKLVGRGRELAELSSLLKETAYGQQQFVFVTGEAGIGKTALVEEFQRKAVAYMPNLRVAAVQCIEGYGGKEPYYPMLEALGQLCRAPGGEWVVQLLSAKAPTWLVQLPSHLNKERPELMRRDLGGVSRDRMLREIGEVLESITARNQLLIVFEDMHWVDHSTVDLLSALARRRTPSKLMLIGTFVPAHLALSRHPLNDLKQDLLVHGLCREIVVEPLAEADVALYLGPKVATTARPSDLSALIYRRSEGNPMFMVAALEEMGRRGFVSNENGELKLTLPVEQIDDQVPETLRQMVELQIGRLDVEEQRVLEAGSITNAGFSPEINAIAANLDVHRFEETCEDLSRRQHMIRSIALQGFPGGAYSPRYEFVHTLYREVFYRRQSTGRREKLHRNIGEQLEKMFAFHLEDVAPELAQHFEEGSDYLRAVGYLRLLSEIAERRYALVEAARVLDHAIEMLEKLSDSQRFLNEMEILEKIATLRTVTFDPRAIEAYEVLRQRAVYYGLKDAEVQALIEMVYPLACIDAGRGLEAVAEALRLCADESDPLAQASTRAKSLTRRVWIRGWSEQDAADWRTALDQFCDANRPDSSALLLLDCNFMKWCSSEYREAYLNTVDGLAVLVDRSKKSAHSSYAYWLSQAILPWSLLLLGQWGEALQSIKAGLSLATRNGDPRHAQNMMLYQAWVHLQAQDFPSVLAICELAQDSLREPAQTPWRRFCLTLIVAAEAARGNVQNALGKLSAFRDELNRKKIIFDWYFELLLGSSLTDLWLGISDLAQAREEADRFLAAALATAERTSQALAWETSARVSLAEKNSDRALECITKGLSTMVGFETPLAAWRVDATAAEVYESMGSPDMANRHRESSRATIRQLADSLANERVLRNIFLSSPVVATIL